MQMRPNNAVKQKLLMGDGRETGRRLANDLNHPSHAGFVMQITKCLLQISVIRHRHHEWNETWVKLDNIGGLNMVGKNTRLICIIRRNYKTAQRERLSRSISRLESAAQRFTCSGIYPPVTFFTREGDTFDCH